MAVASDESLFISYVIDADPALPPGTLAYSVTAPAGDSRFFLAGLRDHADFEVSGMAVGVARTTDSSPLSLRSFPGNGLDLHVNYQDSGQPNTVVPLRFQDDVSKVLDRRRIKVTISSQRIPMPTASPVQPLVALDPGGAPVVLSYDVPEPTSYRGKQIVELDFPADVFAAKPAEEEPVRGTTTPIRPAARNLNDLLVDGDAAIGYAEDSLLYGDQKPQRVTEDAKVLDAFRTAKTTGYLNPAAFPGVRVGRDAHGMQAVKTALQNLSEDTVVTLTKAGNRLVVYRDTGGKLSYKFLPTPVRRTPSLLLVEYYRLSSFPARYGAGRTIKTFSLLPGEKTTIRVRTYKRSTVTMKETSSILDSVTTETESEFERTVLAEQSNQDATSRSLEYHAEAQAEGRATWGWGSASVRVEGGVAGAMNTSRAEFAKNLSNAVSQNAARASSRRDVQIDTSLDMVREEREELAVERELENINLSRTLNFVFRQMNQEFVTLLHLVDLRVAFFNGYAESRTEVPLHQLDQLLGTFVTKEKRESVRAQVLAAVSAITDHTGAQATKFVEPVPNSAVTGSMRVNPGYRSYYRVAPNSAAVSVPGVIVAADQNVMRTDGIVVDSFLGLGTALDEYSNGLQDEAVRERRIENDRKQAEVDRVRLALKLAESGDAAAVSRFETLFPVPDMVNQIDHASINGPDES
ncbi:hypothetical protein [Actinocrispum wychmicini]|uniref:Uncharacterized protein n=1 Tax=Actinocrispum wychmicini TaxID=1213861 RepID=A0A4R2JTB2_9PSEU|nr:hypothetical protein [Actinocrispum wychmicini]TCO60496.1 hypothetical protein EV192_10371 [Actinocrispum wychmicini]